MQDTPDIERIAAALLRGRQLAETVGKEFDQEVAKLLAPADWAKRIG